MAFNNLGAVEYAKKMLGLPYWYGTFGQIASQSLYEEKKGQYKTQYPPMKWTYESFKSQFGQKVHDCVGLAFKGYLMTPQGASNYPMNAAVYNSTYDYSANGFEALAKEKGSISTMPETVGLIVWKNNHVGIYIGNGYVIEAQGHAYGVTKTKLSDRGWQKWIKCPFWDYVSQPTPSPDPVNVEMPELKKGVKCDEVTLFQMAMNNLGYKDANGDPLEIDGSFGGKSECVCIQFQNDNGLKADGICGQKTWQKILHKRYKNKQYK